MIPRWLRVGGVLAVALSLSGSAFAATEVTSTVIIPFSSSVVEASHVVSAAPAGLWGAQITTGAADGYLLILDAAADPGNGPVTPRKCLKVSAQSTAGISPDPNTYWLFSKGIVFVFSTTGCFTETQSATAFFSWQK